ncbi:hypothetical protein [Cohnella sp.]|uniref:hypothetical protein n=1 Tax=Cohnella sp. TaxID=1883426 RepID=UPI00356B2210
MKRYVLTVLLLLFAAGGVGGYYVYAATDRLPEYKLVKVEGDSRIGLEIELSGLYGGRFRSQFLTVSTDGSRYYSRRPFYENTVFSARSWMGEVPGLRELKQKHRQFMRGKGIPDGFLIDGEWAVYAEAASETSNTLKIEHLHLASGKTARFVTELPVQEGLSRMHAVDVQRQGNELHVLTTYYLAMGDKMPSQAYFDNVIDLSSGRLLRQQKLEPSIDRPKNAMVDAVTADGFTTPSGYVVLRVRENIAQDGLTEENSISNAVDSERQTIMKSTLYGYSYKTGQMTKLQVPLTGLNEQWNENIAVADNRIVVVTNHEKRIIILAYDLVSGKIDKELIIAAEDLGVTQMGMTRFRDGKIYMAAQQSSLPIALVLDWENGALLYKGKAVYAGPVSEAEEAIKQLTLLDLKFRA